MSSKIITMKKIFLLCLIAFSFVGADAQSRKNKKSRKGPNKEAIVNARFNKQEASKKLLRDSLIIKMRLEDSTRLAMDSIKNLQADSISIAYRENGLREIDSMNKESYAAIGKNTGQYDKMQRTQQEMIQAARLSDYKSRQVRIINTSYTEKAKAIIQDGDANAKAQQLLALNEERRGRIKALLGKAKEKKLEKERKAFIKKNGVDADTAWMDIAESYAKK
jgi:FtsZ-binding cell division protein ZapB